MQYVNYKVTITNNIQISNRQAPSNLLAETKIKFSKENASGNNLGTVSAVPTRFESLLSACQPFVWCKGFNSEVKHPVFVSAVHEKIENLLDIKSREVSTSTGSAKCDFYNFYN